MTPLAFVAAGAALLLLGLAAAMAWRDAVVAGPAPGSGHAPHVSAVAGAVLTAAVRQDDRPQGRDSGGGSGQGGSGQGGNNQGGPQPGEGTATPELPSALLLLLGLIPLAAIGLVLRRRRRGTPDAG